MMKSALTTCSTNQYEFCYLVQDMFEEQKRAMKHLIKLLKKMSVCCSSFM